MRCGIPDKVGVIVEVVANVLPESWFKDILGQLYFRYIRASVVGEVIEWSRFEDGMLHIKLNNGLEFYALPDTENAKWWRKYRKSQWTDKIAEFRIFRSTYRRILGQFVMNTYERNCQLQKGDTVIDAGASWGFNTVDFSRKVGNKGRIVAIEPDERSLVILRKNIELNGCKNVTIVKKGLWSEKGKMKLYLKELCAATSLVLPGGQASSKVTGTIQVEVDTLDSILEELKIDKVALLKLNIEGAEIEALKGIDRVISKNDDIKVVLDSHHIVDGQPTYKTIIPMMEQMGFSSQFRRGTSYFAKR